jgi:hypothetical protein
MSSALEFFRPIRRPGAPSHDRLMKSDLLSTAPLKEETSVFNSSDTGLMSVVLAQKIVPPEVQAELDVQRENLINLTGVASAYVRKQADETKDPNIVYNTELWQNVYNHLPLMGPCTFIDQNFTQNMKGVEIASSFVGTILGAVVGSGAAVDSFRSFLTGLGDSIRLGISSGTKDYHVGSIGIVLEGLQVGNEIKINPWLKAYFIDFTQENREVYSNCASYESFNISFRYRTAISLFNYGALKDPAIKKEYETFLHGTQIDDIKTASNFFGGKFDTTATRRFIS